MQADLAELLEYLTPSEKADLDRLLTAGMPIWVPQEGPQTEAFESQADFLFYGGSAGGGKTDLIIGLALTQHLKSIIFRREGVQLLGIVERMAEIVGSRDGYNGQDRVWRIGNRVIELGACKDPGSEISYQGRPHDLAGFDEITHFLESQFRFLSGWLRTTTPGQRTRIIAAGNPPTDPEGEWVVHFWGPWLDPDHPRPALPGELRYYAMLDGEEVECESAAAFRHKGETIKPESRTFIPSNVDDNLFLSATGYKARLQALPEPLRSKMLKGDFSAGREDNPFQVIPTDWIKAAQSRWVPRSPGPMDSVGADIARGGRDQTVIACRHAYWFAEPKRYPGSETPNGQSSAGLVAAAIRDRAPAHVDVIGVGSSTVDHLAGLGIHVVPVNNSSSSKRKDKSGQLSFVNKRAEDYWLMREALDPETGDGLALPPDRQLLIDLSTPRWKLTARGIQVESKEEIVKRIGRSPDTGDAYVLANTKTMKMSGNDTPVVAVWVPNDPVMGY